MSDDDSDLAELAYPYALDAMAELERRRVEKRLLETDEDTARQFTTTVRELRETLAAMTVVDALEPPAALEDSLLRALDDKLAVPPQAQRRSGFGRKRWIAAAAAAVIVAIGASIAVVADRSSEPETGLSAQVVLEQPDVLTRTVPVATGGSLTVHTSAGLSAASVSFDGVAQPESGRAYQLWLVRDGTARSAGVVENVPDRGPSVVTRYDSVDTLALTIEPAGGSPQPTSQPIAAVPLA
ncbi:MULTISPECIES: anti-sigma factor [Nocardia]|uniref:anti-sigma factor n=1 Tax=Nocardia TaxID=1817 RepID=UPI000D695FB3|nr:MULTISPECIES: anti-sigma factor [Nocardia]